MSNYATLKSAIQSAVYTNGNGEITGAGLQAVLLQIVNTVGDGYVFKGVATPGTSAGTPDANVFYIAPAGTYSNFGSSYTVPVGSIGVFSYDGSWHKSRVDVVPDFSYSFARRRATGCYFCDMSMSFSTGACTLTLSNLINGRGFIYHTNGYRQVNATISKTFSYTTSLVIIYIDTTDNDAYMASDIQQVPTDAIILEVFYAQDGEIIKVAWTSPFITKTGFSGYDSNCCFSNPSSTEMINSIIVGKSDSKTFPTAAGEGLFYLPFPALAGTKIDVSFSSSSTLTCVLGVLFSDNTRRYNIQVMNNDVHYIYIVDDGKELSQIIVYISDIGTFDLTINAKIEGLVESSKEQLITAKSVKTFQRVGCIGDSYTAGYIKTASNFANSSPNNSWPHYMENLTGNKYDNWGVSGSTAKGWMSGAGKLSDVQAVGNKCQAYIVGLMINDRTNEPWNLYYTPVGVASDIGTNNDTYYAWYYKLIQAVVAVNADAKIFCCTCPKWSSADAYNVAVKDIVQYCKTNSQNVYLCDLAGEDFSVYYQDETFVNDLTNGHYTAIGYEYMAEAFVNVLSDIINANLSEFKDIAFIPFDV